MAETFKELAGLSDDDLKAQYDRRAESTVTGISFYLDELRSRSNDRVTRSVERLTKWLLLLTVAITFATIVQVIVVVLNNA